jgi:hypothetical protein
MKKMSGALIFILGWLFITIFLVFFVQSREMYGANPIVKQRLDTLEAFHNRAPVENIEDPDMKNITPGNPDLSDLRRPFNLLNDWLDPLEKPMYPSAKRCHDLDYQGRLERTGNFRQMTNNYKRGDPDSCSAPIQDITLAFYKTQAVPQYGCISPH